MFQVYTRFSFQNLDQKGKYEFNTYIKLLPILKQVLIKNYKESSTAEPLINLIQQHHKLIIALDGSKSSKTSGGGWLIVDAEGSKLLTGFNPDFGDINQINSHRAEIYRALSVFLFLHKYCKFYRLQLQSLIEYICDNKEVVQELSHITDCNRNYYSSNSKIIDLDTVLEIQKYIPNNIKVNHVRGHQDKKKRKEQLTMAEN